MTLVLEAEEAARGRPIPAKSRLEERHFCNRDIGATSCTKEAENVHTHEGEVEVEGLCRGRDYSGGRGSKAYAG